MLSRVLGISIDYEYISWTIVDSYYLKVIDVGRREIKYKNKNLGKISKQARRTKYIKLLQSYDLTWDVSEYPTDVKKSYFINLRKKGLDSLLKNKEIFDLLYFFLLNRGIYGEKNIKEHYQDYRTYGEYIYENQDEEKVVPPYRSWIKSEIAFLIQRQLILGASFPDEFFIEKYFDIFEFEKTTSKKLKICGSENSKVDVLLKAIDNKSFLKDNVVYGIVKGVCSLILELLANVGAIGQVNIFIKSDDELIDLNCEELDRLSFKYKKTFGSSLKKDDLMKLYLYYEQNYTCVYSGDRISFQELFNSNLYEVDHIIARSRGGANSLSNKALVKKDINREKDDLLLYEYMTSVSQWTSFKDRINSIYKEDSIKKRNFLLEDLTDYSPDISINPSQKNNIYKVIRLVNEVLNRCYSGVNINCIKSEVLIKNAIDVIESEEGKIEGDTGYKYSFITSNIDSYLINTFLNTKENIEGSKLKNKIINSFFYNEVGIFNQIIKDKIYSKKVYFIKKKLTEITKADLDLIDDRYLNNDLVQLIKLRMSQFDYDAEKAFEEEIFNPSKDWNGTVINKINIRVNKGARNGQALESS